MEMNESSEVVEQIEEKLEENEFHNEVAQEEIQLQSVEPQTVEEAPAVEEAPVVEEPGPVSPEPQTHSELVAAQQALGQDALHLQQQYNTVDWKRLREVDPAQYAILSQEFQAAQQSLKDREQAIINAQGNLAQSYISSERDKLLNALPAWNDEQVMEQEKTELRDFLQKKGYSDREISQFSARDVLMAREAMLSSKAKPKKKLLKKKRAKKKGVDGLDPRQERLMERGAKQRPGGKEDIALRLMRMGI